MKNISFCIVLLTVVQAMWGQCSGGANAGLLTPVPGPAFQVTPVSDGAYYTFTVPTGGCNTYSFTFCSNSGAATWDTELTILDNAGVAVAGGYNDDACSFQSEILNWSPPAAGTYRILVNHWPCSVVGATGWLAYIETNTILGNHSVIGNATLSNPQNCVTLTPNSPGQRGCAWNPYVPLDFTQPFTYDFTINLGSNNAGADGIAFVIQNDPTGLCACGSQGGALGASGITNSLIIEIDTYLNAEDRDDGIDMANVGVACSGGTEPDHLDVWVNGLINPPGGVCPGTPGARIIPSASPLLDGGVLYDIENGLDHILRVAWTPGNPGTISASLMNTALTSTFASVQHSFDPLALFGTNTPFYGFTSATGALFNQHTFCSPVVLLEENSDQDEIGEFPELAFDIFPNPLSNNQYATIVFPDNSTWELDIVNQAGVRVLREYFEDVYTQALTLDLPAGIYQLILKGGEGPSQIKRIVILD